MTTSGHNCHCISVFIKYLASNNKLHLCCTAVKKIKSSEYCDIVKGSQQTT